MCNSLLNFYRHNDGDTAEAESSGTAGELDRTAVGDRRMRFTILQYSR